MVPGITGRKCLHTWLFVEEKEPASAWELPGRTRLGDATGRQRAMRAGVRATEHRCDPRWRLSRKGSFGGRERKRATAFQEEEGGVGWSFSHSFISGYLRSTCCMLGILVVNRSSVPALLEQVSYLSRTRGQRHQFSPLHITACMVCKSCLCTLADLNWNPGSTFDLLCGSGQVT